MRAGISKALLALAISWSSVGHAAAALRPKSASQEVHFSDHDLTGQWIAKKLLGNGVAEDDDAAAGGSTLWTAWVRVSDRKAPDLFVMYGCSPTGNCGLYGFEHARSGWRQVLNSLAQKCSIFATSHGGRRDIAAYMHGSATEGILKVYWWRGSRYVRVSERGVAFQ